MAKTVAIGYGEGMAEAIPWGMLFPISMLVFASFCVGFCVAKGPRFSPMLWKFIEPDDPDFVHGRRTVMTISLALLPLGCIFLLFGVY